MMSSRFKRVVQCWALISASRRDATSSGEVSRNGRISKHGNGMTRKHLYEAATTLLTRTRSFSTLKAWGLRLAKISGFKKARVAVARKLAVILHAMWKTNTEFRWSKPGRMISIIIDLTCSFQRERVPAGTHGADQAVPLNAAIKQNLPMMTAWTTSADPPSDANMRQTSDSTAERTLSPARMLTG